MNFKKYIAVIFLSAFVVAVMYGITLLALSFGILLFLIKLAVCVIAAIIGCIAFMVMLFWSLSILLD